jgi:hypothetical protein
MNFDKVTKHTDLEDRLAIARSHKQASTHLASSDHSASERIIFLIAESAKDVQARELYAASDIFQPLADILLKSDSSDALKLQVFYKLILDLARFRVALAF